jgi:hypothetical protein
MRIGIFTGPVVAGTLGSADRSEYVTVGDTMNIASRLESYDKEFFAPDPDARPCRTLIGETTLVYLGDEFETARVGEIRLKGKEHTVRVYRLVRRRVTPPGGGSCPNGKQTMHTKTTVAPLVMSGVFLLLVSSGVSAQDVPAGKADAVSTTPDVAPTFARRPANALPVYKPPMRGAPGGRVGGGTRGIHRIRLADYPVKLEPGVAYRWSVTVVPDPDRRSRDILASGTIERVEPSPALAARLQSARKDDLPFIYAEEGIWYDALAALSDLIDSAPEDADLHRQRAALLTQARLPQITAGP